MEKILGMKKSGVKEEIMALLQPVEDRLVQQEKITEELSRKVTIFMKKMQDLKMTTKNLEDFAALAAQATGVKRVFREGEKGRQNLWSSKVQEDIDTNSDEDYKEDVRDLCASGRRVIGFTPIEPRMLDLQMRSYGAKNLEEAILMEIKSYLKCELKVRPSDIEKLDIVKIFPPAKENWNVLYVEFGNEHQVDQLFTYTKRMVKQDHRVVRWFPRQMYDRYRAVEAIGYEIRKSVKHKTRVNIGFDDIELHTRMPNSNVWRKQPLPYGLPRIDTSCKSRPTISSSPPPGRPGRSVMYSQAVGVQRPAQQKHISNPITVLVNSLVQHTEAGEHSQ